MRRAKIKPALSNQYAHVRELEFEHSKYLFGEDITKNISKAKETPYQGLFKKCL